MMAQRLAPPHRTQGDGMERVENTEHVVVLAPKQHEDVFDADGVPISKIKSTKHLSGAMVSLTPHSIVGKKKDNLLKNMKNKEPKFVPYEPYKAAVKPIIPNEKKHKKRSVEPKAVEQVVDQFKNSLSIHDNLEAERKSLKHEIHMLKLEKDELEGQLKFQCEVNTDLKNLLVAAVGEDMELKVNGLTEDKLHLAQALLKSSKTLTTHQEQTEWLASQCEVWRSKFLASSVMVEELSKWKNSLTQKLKETHEVTKKLLEERKQVREYLLRCHQNLCHLRDSFDVVNKKSLLKTSHVLDVSAEIARISDVLVLQLLGLDRPSTSYQDVQLLPSLTQGELAAEHALYHTNHHLEPDAACCAVVNAAEALSGQLYLQSHPPKIKCCAHCSGEIKLV